MTGDPERRGPWDPAWRGFDGVAAFAPHPATLDPQAPPYVPPRDTAPAKPRRPESEPSAGLRTIALPPPTLSTSVPLPRPSATAQFLGRLRGRRPWRQARAAEWLRRPRTPIVAALAGGLAVAVVAGVVFGRRAASPSFAAQFAAPILRLQAAGPGQIVSVAVSRGQTVEPTTVLMTIRTDRAPDPAADDIKTRLAQARTRQGGDEPAPSAAIRRQRDAAGAEADQLDHSLAAVLAANPPNDLPVLAGVRGTVWALDAKAGSRAKTGDPLVQLADCGRAFLVPRAPIATLKAGASVLIRLGGMAPFHGAVRASVGVSEPPDTLVIEPSGLWAVAVNACPVGEAAEIQVEDR